MHTRLIVKDFYSRRSTLDVNEYALWEKARAAIALAEGKK